MTLNILNKKIFDSQYEVLTLHLTKISSLNTLNKEIIRLLMKTEQRSKRLLDS